METLKEIQGARKVQGQFCAQGHEMYPKIVLIYLNKYL